MMKMDFILQSIRSYNYPSGYSSRIPLHRHLHSAELWWVENGIVEIEASNQVRRVSSGELLFLPAGLWHSLQFRGPVKQRIRKLGFSSSTPSAEEQFQISKPENAAYIGALLDEMEREFPRMESDVRHKLQLLLKLLLTEMGGNPAGMMDLAADSCPFTHIRHEMEETCHLPFSLDATAAQAGMSKFHFSRRFKESCRQTPLQFVIGCRMDRARYLLETTEQEFPSIALSCGYKSPTQFHAAFTRHTGFTPKGYRKQYPKETKPDA